MKKKTAPWLPIDSAWWPAIAETIPHPWPAEAVSMDLRWWEDQETMGRAKRPGRPALRARWGWTDRKARNAMKAAPERQKSSQSPARVQPASSQSPETDTQTPDIIGPRVQPESSPRPARVQPESPRVIKHKTQDRRHKTENKTITSDRPSPVRQVWVEINKIRIEKMPGAKDLKLTKARSQQLKARIMEHSATDVQAVIKWWLVSRHPRADYLRENGHGIDTLLRASNFAKYLEMAQEPKQGAPAQRVVHLPKFKKQLPPLSTYPPTAVKTAEAELASLRDSCTHESWDKLLRTALQQAAV